MAATNIWDKKTPQRKAVQIRASHQTAFPHRAKGKLREEAEGKKQTIQVREKFPIHLGRFQPPYLIGNCPLPLPLLLLNQT